MLYVSTRNTEDTFTAYKALNEKTAPDGGLYIPFHLPQFNQEELAAMKSRSCCDVIAQVLNFFFGVRLTELDVEFELGKLPFKTENLQRKFLVAECWHNPGYSYDCLLKTLYGLMSESKAVSVVPTGWACVGIKIALLFGLYSVLGSAMDNVDIAVTAGDYSDIVAVMYAKSMGLPVGVSVCACNDSALWDLINKGEFAVETTDLHYMECFLCAVFGKEVVLNAQKVTQKRISYYFDEEQQAILANNVYAAVVSGERGDTVRSNMYSTNGYTFDSESALAYGALQDYRSSTGISKDTLLFAKDRPARIKE